MLFNSKQKRAEKALSLVFSYINDAAKRFAGLYFDESYQTVVIYCTAVMIHFVRFIFNVEDTILEMYFKAADFSSDVENALMDVYYELQAYMNDEEAKKYYDKMCILNGFARIAENSYNHILDLRYGQLIYALECLLDDYDLQWKSTSNNMPANQAIYWFFVGEEPTIKPIQQKVLDLFK